MEKIENKNYKILTPFKGWVLQNFPFIEADFDALTNYDLICKITEYLNNIIYNQNEVQDLSEELVKGYNDLLDYVNNYFDNLDVQEEINNKLDQMAQDGSLTNLIKNYVDPIYQAYENRINAEVNQINTKVNATTNYIPIPVDSTASMTDTTKLYVNTTNGKWYYYDGDSWEIGGTYQGVGLSTTDENRLKKLENEVFILNPGLNNKGYINSTGVFTSNTSYGCTDYIDITGYNKIRYYAILYNPNYMVAFYDSDKTFVSEGSVVGTGSVKYDVISIPDGVKFVRVCNYTTNNANPYVYIYNDNSLVFEDEYIHKEFDIYDTIKGECIELNPSFSEDNKYIGPQGVLVTISNCKATLMYNCKGFTKIDYKLNIATANYIIAYYDKDMKFLSDVSIHGSSSTLEDIATIPDSAYYVRFCNYTTNNANPRARLYKENSLYSKVESGNSVLQGKKIGYLGDSITNGYLATKPFRTIITEKTGSTQYNYGINSSTLSDYNGGSNPVVDRYQDMDASLDYVCVLIGTNDTAPMGDETSTDTTTFYGALNTLIVGLITRYTDKKIMFMTLLPRRNSNLTARNEAIRKRCAYYSIPCFDLFINSNMNPNIDIVNTTLFANSDGLHPNNDGHEMLANKIQKALESI